MKIAFAELDMNKPGAIAVGFYEGREPTPSFRRLDEATGGALGRAVAASKATGRLGELVDLLGPAGIGAQRVVMFGLGKPSDLATGKVTGLGGGIAAMLLAGAAEQAQVAVDPPGEGPLDAPALAVALALGARLRAYRFDKYLTKRKPEEVPALGRIAFCPPKPGQAKKLWAEQEAVVEGVVLARDLISEPGNVVHPASFADICRDLGKLGVDVEVVGEKDLRKLGMGALLGVGQGSEKESHVVVMRWRGAKSDRPALAMIGKGVCFDSGGLSLKQPKQMEEMKWDMAGAAAVTGAIKTLALRKAKADVVGILALVENMPSGTAQRPGDIVKSMSGQTIEVLNTDAEGRLILADVVWYAQDRFKPDFMVDLATLTGAIIIALGHEHAGMFTNNDELADALTMAGKTVGETVWRMPLGEAYDKLIKSDVADMKNIGDGSAGSIVGAQFIGRFTNDRPWAHLDIAGVGYASKDSPTAVKGATGWGVRLLDQLVRSRFEE
jgi:leucyl aminopeptidase